MVSKVISVCLFLLIRLSFFGYWSIFFSNPFVKLLRMTDGLTVDCEGFFVVENCYFHYMML